MEAIKNLKNGKAAGIDCIIAEVMKNGGRWMVESVWVLCKILKNY